MEDDAGTDEVHAIVLVSLAIASLNHIDKPFWVDQARGQEMKAASMLAIAQSFHTWWFSPVRNTVYTLRLLATSYHMHVYICSTNRTRCPALFPPLTLVSRYSDANLSIEGVSEIGRWKSTVDRIVLEMCLPRLGHRVAPAGTVHQPTCPSVYAVSLAPACHWLCWGSPRVLTPSSPG